MILFAPSGRILIFALACATAAVAGYAKMEETETPKLKALDLLMARGIREHVFPGAVLIVGQPGKILWAKASGRQTYDTTSPKMAFNTMFDLASVTKVMGTATAAMLLVEDGKISPDDKVSRAIPGFEANGKQNVTVRHLMTHTSGLKPYETTSVVEKKRHQGEAPADALIRHYASLKPLYEAGTSMTYSCLNMQTMARVVETSGGERMDTLLKRRVWGPLEMTDTAYALTPEQAKRCAPTILYNNGTMLRGEVHDPIANYHTAAQHCPGNAGLFATAPDAARFCEMILNEGALDGKKIFNPETVRLMTSVQTPPSLKETRALGWDTYDRKPYATRLNNTTGTLIIGHTGYTGTFLWLDKKTKTYIVFFTNRVFPNDASAPKRKPSIMTMRQKVCDTVLRSLPRYRSYFAKDK
ncbi:MAG: serine hydrolase domain-containing protein [bacterium]